MFKPPTLHQGVVFVPAVVVFAPFALAGSLGARKPDQPAVLRLTGKIFPSAARVI